MSADFKQLYKPPMDKKFFDKVVQRGRKRKPELVAAVEGIMVDGLRPAEVLAAVPKKKKPIDGSHLKRTVDAIEKQRDELLEEHDLAYISIVVPNYLKEALLKIHDHHVELLAAKPKKR